MIVVDASIIATALGDDGEDGHLARAQLVFETLFAPELIDLEVVSVWRRSQRSGRLSHQRARQALVDLVDLPIKRFPHRPLMPRIWELRENMTPYDAAYISLSEALKAPFLTADSALGKAPGIGCQVRVITYNNG